MGLICTPNNTVCNHCTSALLPQKHDEDSHSPVMLSVTQRPCSMIDAQGRLHVRPNKRKDVVLSSVGKVQWEIVTNENIILILAMNRFQIFIIM